MYLASSIYMNKRRRVDIYFLLKCLANCVTKLISTHITGKKILSLHYNILIPGILIIIQKLQLIPYVMNISILNISTNRQLHIYNQR